MNCFVGGSGSTGSSVLANVLNRHSRLFCGPETYLFTKHQLFEDWSGNKGKLVDGKLKSFPWHKFSNTELLNPAFEWDTKALKELIHYSNFIHEFADEFFGHSAKMFKKYHWIEKTPSNVYCFQNLVESFPNCFLIHTVRNPYDTIASLNRRGFSVYDAVCLYLLNTSVGLSMNKYHNYIEVIYEELVTRPDEKLREICQLLSVRFEPEMLLKQETAFDDDIESWNLSEKAAITSDSIGNFAKLSRFVQDEIIYTINSVRISSFYQQRFNLELLDIKSICEHFNFQHYPDDGFHNIFQLQIDKSRDHISRIVRAYPSKFGQYPIDLT